MQNSLILASLALATGVVIGIFVQFDPDTPDVSVSVTEQDQALVASDQTTGQVFSSNLASDSLIALEQRLEEEIDARIALEKKLAELNRKITDLDRNAQLADDSNLAAKAEDQDESGLPGSDQRWFNEQALIENGMNHSQALELKINFEQLELERLYLRDQSIREGWDRDRYREAQQALTSKEDELKNQLSESEYDSYLYASGQTNRVAVTSVLESAPAATAGIEPGDHIIRYDNQRIYNWFELRDATSTGEIGETIAVEVDRDGEIIELYLARGPLGIRMNSVSVAP
ncbi:MAG: PDZ domain-containing protein [Gammaproteobacteria bacterium]|nr:PDZ domain-containing protein [Gammaproteobacteria bacterium]MDH3859508.1 PDZ domain-containing protein [Gammaproteobacteria bacterium]